MTCTWLGRWGVGVRVAQRTVFDSFEFECNLAAERLSAALALL